MKRYGWIGLLFLTLLACHCAPESPGVPAAPQRPELVAIDTLMQSRPDSALAMLLAEPLDDPYYHLLLSEALYKNDSAQVNRPKLLAAMASFDSAAASPRSASQQAYLAARCHYMNGVGYYEMDSVVRACEQYMTALEIMEERFSEKDLVGPKAKFMALTYTHLTQLFSDQYLHEQAIFFGKRAMVYNDRVDASCWHSAWVLGEIGSNYNITGAFDSAFFYYNKGLEALCDTNNLTYRDLSVQSLFLTYEINGEASAVLKPLQYLLDQSESDREHLARCLTIGEILFKERQYDLAYVYLSAVFHDSESINSKKQAAEWLMEINKAQNKVEEALECAGFLAQFATQDENNSALKSMLTELYNDNRLRELDRLQQQRLKKQAKKSIAVFAGLLLVSLLCYLMYRKNKKRQQNLEVKIEKERQAHRIKQKALAGRLKSSNEALKIQEKRTSDLTKAAMLQQRRKEWSCLEVFMDESICQEILAMLENKVVKKTGDYPELCLNSIQLHDLSFAVEKHFHEFEKTLTDLYPKISRNAMSQCLLYLLNLEDVQISALLSCDYSTVKKRTSKLKTAFKTKKEPRQFIRDLVS